VGARIVFNHGWLMVEGVPGRLTAPLACIPGVVPAAAGGFCVPVGAFFALAALLRAHEIAWQEIGYVEAAAGIRNDVRL
jgi:hypothetical protein